MAWMFRLLSRLLQGVRDAFEISAFQEAVPHAAARTFRIVVTFPAEPGSTTVSSFGMCSGSPRTATVPLNAAANLFRGVGRPAAGRIHGGEVPNSTRIGP